MLFLQFLRQCGAFVEIRRQLHRATQRIGDRGPACAAVLPVLGHDAKLLGDHFGQRRVPRPGLVLRRLENVGVQMDR